MSQINILFAEDHKLFRELLIKTLKENNINTIGEAENGIQLLELLKTKKPDIVLLDIEMPHMNGSEAFTRLRDQYPDLKIILLTTHTEETLINSFYEKGAKAYLTKNTDADIVIETIQLVYENKFVRKQKILKTNIETSAEIKFSRRESEIIHLMVEGKSNKQIADKLSIGNKTVEAHKKNLFKKTKTESAVGFVSYILKKGLNYLR
ncbi:MAG: response regulator transcription factor [Bacteroidetes bacterium]|nr:response regulator transcription factor [Bacteroidota bacterium]